MRTLGWFWICQVVKGSSDGKESAFNSGDLGLILPSGRSPGEGNGNPLQYSCLENPMDGGACQAIVYEVTKSQIPLSNFTLQLCKGPTGFVAGYFVVRLSV